MKATQDILAFLFGLIEGGILLDWFRSRQALQVKENLHKPLKTLKTKKSWLDD